MRIAVVGAGWAGLAAAVELRSQGAEVVLFEAGRVPGGRARSVSLDGRTLDNGQHILLGAYRDTLALMRRVGADPEHLFERRPLQIIDNQGFRLALPAWPAPFNVAAGLLSCTVDWREKLKTAVWMQSVKLRKFRVPNDQTVADWLDAAGQTGPLRRQLWEPLCLAALNTPAERASAQLFANVLRDSLGSPRQADTDLLLPRVPLGELFPEPATRWLIENGAECRFSHRVSRIETNDTQLRVDSECFDGAVLASAPQHLARLWPTQNTPTDYEPIATVYLQFEAKTALSFPLLNMAEKDSPWVVDRGRGLLGCVLSGHGPWETLDDGALTHQFVEQLKFGSPQWSAVIREKRATFSARPGLIRADWRTQDSRLVLAGDHTWSAYPATLEGAVRSGLRAAEGLAQQITSSR